MKIYVVVGKCAPVVIDKARSKESAEALIARYEREDRYEIESLPDITERDRAALIEAYKAARENFVKRVNAYLKRYGLSKVRSWTYWGMA